MGVLSPQAVDVNTNLDATWDLRYRLGNKPQVQRATLDYDRAAFNAAAISLIGIKQGALTSINFRQFLTGTSRLTATLTVTAVTGSLGDWTLQTDNLISFGNPPGGPSALQVIATDNAGNVVPFPLLNWSIIATASHTNIVWNPGNYGAPNFTATAGPDRNNVAQDNSARFFADMDDILKDDWMNGYRVAYKVHGLDAGIASCASSAAGLTTIGLTGIILGQGHPTSGSYVCAFVSSTTSATPLAIRRCTLQGTTLSWAGALPAGSMLAVHFYNFNLSDAILNRLANNYSRPRQLVLDVEVMTFSGGTRGADKQTIPNYMLLDPTTYGAGPDGAGGWWGAAVGDTTKNHLYSMATWRPAVARMYAMLGTVLGWAYNSNPLFEGIMDQEPSAAVQAAFAGTQWPGIASGPNAYPGGSNDGTYGSDANYRTQMQLYLTAWRTAFPNCSVIQQNTYLATATPSQQHEEWMIIGGQAIAPSTADVISHTRNVNSGFTVAGWGPQAYRGVTSPGSSWTGPDRSNIARAMVDLESGDYGPVVLAGTAGTTTLQDLWDAIELDYKASHIFWCRRSAAEWAFVTAFLQTHKPSNNAYPKNYS